MFDHYLPEGLYENLPAIHVTAAALVALAPLSPVRWVAVVALLLAATLTVRRRQRFRRPRLRRQPDGRLPGGHREARGAPPKTTRAPRAVRRSPAQPGRPAAPPGRSDVGRTGGRPGPPGRNRRGDRWLIAAGPRQGMS